MKKFPFFLFFRQEKVFIVCLFFRFLLEYNMMFFLLFLLKKGLNMNKLSMIETLHQETGISKPDAKKIVGMFFDEMADALVNGDRIEIRGFCSFFVKNYKSYTGRNPKTGAKVTVPSKKLPFFKCGKELKKRINS